MIPRINAAALLDYDHPDHSDAVAQVRDCVADLGFLTLYNTPLSAQDVAATLAAYRAFFALPAGKGQGGYGANWVKSGLGRAWV